MFASPWKQWWLWISTSKRWYQLYVFSLTNVEIVPLPSNLNISTKYYLLSFSLLQIPPIVSNRHYYLIYIVFWSRKIMSFWFWFLSFFWFKFLYLILALILFFKDKIRRKPADFLKDLTLRIKTNTKKRYKNSDQKNKNKFTGIKIKNSLTFFRSDHTVEAYSK